MRHGEHYDDQGHQVGDLYECGFVDADEGYGVVDEACWGLLYGVCGRKEKRRYGFDRLAGAFFSFFFFRMMEVCALRWIDG